MCVNITLSFTQHKNTLYCFSFDQENQIYCLNCDCHFHSCKQWRRLRLWKTHGKLMTGMSTRSLKQGGERWNSARSLEKALRTTKRQTPSLTSWHQQAIMGTLCQDCSQSWCPLFSFFFFFFFFLWLHGKFIWFQLHHVWMRVRRKLCIVLLFFFIQKTGPSLHVRNRRIHSQKGTQFTEIIKIVIRFVCFVFSFSCVIGDENGSLRCFISLISFIFFKIQNFKELSQDFFILSSWQMFMSFKSKKKENGKWELFK